MRTRFKCLVLQDEGKRCVTSYRIAPREMCPFQEAFCWLRSHTCSHRNMFSGEYLVISVYVLKTPECTGFCSISQSATTAFPFASVLVDLLVIFSFYLLCFKTDFPGRQHKRSNNIAIPMIQSLKRSVAVYCRRTMLKWYAFMRSVVLTAQLLCG